MIHIHIHMGSCNWPRSYLAQWSRQPTQGVLLQVSSRVHLAVRLRDLELDRSTRDQAGRQLY